MMVSRVQRRTRRPPAVCADGAMVVPRPLAARGVRLASMRRAATADARPAAGRARGRAGGLRAAAWTDDRSERPCACPAHRRVRPGSNRAPGVLPPFPAPDRGGRDMSEQDEPRRPEDEPGEPGAEGGSEGSSDTPPPLPERGRRHATGRHRSALRRAQPDGARDDPRHLLPALGVRACSSRSSAWRASCGGRCARSRPSCRDGAGEWGALLARRRRSTASPRSCAASAGACCCARTAREPSRARRARAERRRLHGQQHPARAGRRRHPRLPDGAAGAGEPPHGGRHAAGRAAARRRGDPHPVRGRRLRPARRGRRGERRLDRAGHGGRRRSPRRAASCSCAATSACTDLAGPDALLHAAPARAPRAGAARAPRSRSGAIEAARVDGGRARRRRSR